MQAELHQDEIRERTGGVYWQGKLEATLIDESIALQRGIRRSADKVALHLLSSQGRVSFHANGVIRVPCVFSFEALFLEKNHGHKTDHLG